MTKTKAEKTGGRKNQKNNLQGMYEDWTGERGLERIRIWARRGFTEEDIAKGIGISLKSLKSWQKECPRIETAIKEGISEADLVEESLYKMSVGYAYKVKKHMKLKNVEYDEGTGKKIKEEEEIKEYFDEVRVPGSVTAAMFWLKNRSPKYWRSSFDIEPAEGEEESYIIEIPAAAEEKGQEEIKE